jgi:hypothetical protein
MVHPMRRTTVSFIGLTAVAALTACGAHVATLVAPGSSPAAQATLPPSRPLQAAAAIMPTVPPNPGTLTPCSQLPFPGPVAMQDQLHDCWVVEPAGSSDLSKYEFFMGGTSPKDRQQGILIFERPNAGGSQNVYSVPGHGGDVTVYLARWSFVCYKTASGAAGEFDAETATFVTDQARVGTDCGKAP